MGMKAIKEAREEEVLEVIKQTQMTKDLYLEEGLQNLEVVRIMFHLVEQSKDQILLTFQVIVPLLDSAVKVSW